MPTIDLGDFSKIGAMPPEGYYRFHCPNNGVIKQNNAKDGHTIHLDANIIDSPDPDFENFHTRQFLSLKVAARWKLKEQLEALTQEEWSDESTELEIDEDNNVISPSFEDKTFIGLVVHGTDQNDKPQAQIKTWFPDDGSVEIGLATEEE